MPDPQIGTTGIDTASGRPVAWDGIGWKYTDQQTPTPRSRTWTDTAVDALPMVGGAVGGGLGMLTGIPTLGLSAGPAAVVGAGVLGAGGEAARQLINRARGMPAPETPSAATQDIALQGAGQAALEGAGQAAMPLLRIGGRAVYRGYLKPSLSRVNLAKAKTIVDTAIHEGLPVTESGMAQAQHVIGELKGQVDTILASQPGRTVNLQEVADQVRAFAKRMYDRPGRNPGDYQAALAIADRIDNHPSMVGHLVEDAIGPRGNPEVDLATANQIKQDLQAGVGETQYGIKSAAAKTTEKVGASEMRQAIEQQAPAVAPLNARASRLIDVARSLQRAIGREANRNALFGVPSLMAGGLGVEQYALRHNPLESAVTMLATRMALTPAVATRAAILAVKMGQTIPGAAVADVARAAIQAVLETEQQAEGHPSGPQ